MKIILYIICMLGVGFAAGSVHAARSVPGVVPSLAPLFPTPVGVEANVSGNIQNQGASLFTESASAGQAHETASVESEHVQPTPVAGGATESQESASIPWGWWALGLAVVVVVSVGWFRKRKGVI